MATLPGLLLWYGGHFPGRNPGYQLLIVICHDKKTLRLMKGFILKLATTGLHPASGGTHANAVTI
ncbi:MAG: hypothetical protein GXY51_05365 [Bacteroidetes bacterium]|nr:hypothetical protein [Bacteroidota bacterium]